MFVHRLRNCGSLRWSGKWWAKYSPVFPFEIITVYYNNNYYYYYTLRCSVPTIGCFALDEGWFFVCYPHHGDTLSSPDFRAIRTAIPAILSRCLKNYSICIHHTCTWKVCNKTNVGLEHFVRRRIMSSWFGVIQSDYAPTFIRNLEHSSSQTNVPPKGERVVPPNRSYVIATLTVTTSQKTVGLLETVPLKSLQV